MFAVGMQLLLITTFPVLPSLLSVLLFSGNSFLLPCNSQRSWSYRRVNLCHSGHSSCTAFLSFFQPRHRLSLLLGIPLSDAEKQINSCQFAREGKSHADCLSELWAHTQQQLCGACFRWAAVCWGATLLWLRLVLWGLIPGRSHLLCLL